MNYGWGAPLTKGVQIYSFASFLNFMDGDKAGLGFDRAPLRTGGWGVSKTERGRRGLVSQTEPNE